MKTVQEKTNFGDKPYNRCLTCRHRGVRCDGPRTSAMSLGRWCEFMRDMKKANGLTNIYVAETADISVKTIERLMALTYDKDILRDTARRIEDAIIGSSNQYPCILAYEEELPDDTPKIKALMQEMEHILGDNRMYKTTLDNIHASYAAEIQTIREESKEKTEQLLTQIDRLRQEIDYLRLENDRKARIIDKFLDK